jgi:hypothetical protein
MEITRRSDGKLEIVYDIDEQVEALISINPKTEEDSEKIQAILLDTIDEIEGRKKTC